MKRWLDLLMDDEAALAARFQRKAQWHLKKNGNLEGAPRRVAWKFAAIYAAGSLAIEQKILPWEKRFLRDVVKTAWERSQRAGRAEETSKDDLLSGIKALEVLARDHLCACPPFKMASGRNFAETLRRMAFCNRWRARISSTSSSNSSKQPWERGVSKPCVSGEWCRQNHFRCALRSGSASSACATCASTVSHLALGASNSKKRGCRPPHDLRRRDKTHRALTILSLSVCVFAPCSPPQMDGAVAKKLIACSLASGKSWVTRGEFHTELDTGWQSQPFFLGGCSYPKGRGVIHSRATHSGGDAAAIC